MKTQDFKPIKIIRTNFESRNFSERTICPHTVYKIMAFNKTKLNSVMASTRTFPPHTARTSILAKRKQTRERRSIRKKWDRTQKQPWNDNNCIPVHAAAGDSPTTNTCGKVKPAHSCAQEIHSHRLYLEGWLN